MPKMSSAADSPPLNGHIYTFDRDLNGWVRKASTSSTISSACSSSSVSSYHTSPSTAACSPASSTTTFSSAGLPRSSSDSTRKGNDLKPIEQQKDGQDVGEATQQCRLSTSYTRPMTLNIHGRGPTFRVISSREIRGVGVATLRPPRQRSGPFTSTAISSSSRRNRLPGIGAHGYPFLCYPNNGTPANTPERSPGPNPLDMPHPIPDIIISDFSLLLSAWDRYAASSLSDMQVRPYHNVADPALLGRYSGRGRPGYKVPKCGASGHEIVDGERFGRMGGQKSVIGLAGRISQLREVENGCPSRCCGCRGSGVAMAACGDLEEDEDEEAGALAKVDGSSTVSSRNGRLRRMPCTDRVSEAREMRARVDKRRLDKEIHERNDETKYKNNSQGGQVQKEGVVSARTQTVRKRTLRRKTSRFTEIGCTLGDDSLETLSPATTCSLKHATGPRNVVEANAEGMKTSRKALRTPTQRTKKKSWVRRILHLRGSG